MTILIIDNYDSFTYNLVQYIGEQGFDIRIKKNDEIIISELDNINIKGIVISPGPGRPEDSEQCIRLIQYFAPKLPILGICLGHQSIAYAYGAKIISAPLLKHGKTSPVYHNENNLFTNIENPLIATRYHSLIVDNNNLPNSLCVNAWSDDHIIMGLNHSIYKNVYGIQFHPESILTVSGKKIIKNFLHFFCNFQ
ncbi:anthranilate synthase component II (chloroplast) [Galdieria partita]|uniref:Anthranilate synthase component 2 n=1 Tax=Galdieria partita TaxID=83374 RepID=A0A9C7BH49_9RHOD|nr:anthranilate synthase component II [Galdieria partita]